MLVLDVLRLEENGETFKTGTVETEGGRGGVLGGGKGCRPGGYGGGTLGGEWNLGAQSRQSEP